MRGRCHPLRIRVTQEDALRPGHSRFTPDVAGPFFLERPASYLSGIVAEFSDVADLCHVEPSNLSLTRSPVP